MSYATSPLSESTWRRNLLFGLTLVALLSAGACGRDAGFYLAKGNALFAKGEFAEAELNYRKAVQKDSSYGEAYYRTALCELKEDKPVAALQDLDQAVHLMPDNKDAKRQLTNLVLGGFIGDASRPKSLYERLVQLSNEWLQRDPQSAEGLRIKGYLAMVEQRPQEAVALLVRAQQANPKDERINMGLMDALYRAGDPLKAEKVGLDFIASDPTAGDVYDALFRIYVATQRPGDAENILLRKTKESPKENAYILQLAGYYASVRKKSEMDAMLQAFLRNPGGDSQVHLKAGDFYATIGNLPSALDQYRTGATADAKNKLIYQNRMVRTLLLQNKRDDALNILNQVVTEHPGDTESKSLRAALAVGTSGAAVRQGGVQEFKSLVEKSPDDTYLRFLYAKALLETGDLATARTELQEVVRQNPHFVEAQVSLGDLKFQQGDLAEALVHAGAALQIDPNHLRARMLRGSVLLQQGQFDEAAGIFGVLAREVPASVDVRLQLAYVDVNKRRYPEAEAAFKKLLDANPKEWRAVAGLVDTYLAQNRPEKALAILEDQLARSHGSPQIRYMLANTALKSGRYDIAIENLRQLAEQAPNAFDAQLRLGDVYRLRGDIPQAITAVQKAARLKPDDPRPVSMMTLLLELQNRKQEAKEQARRALSLKPDDADAMNNLAYLLAETGDSLDEALRLARKAVEKAPANGAFIDTLGYIYLKRDQNDDALAIFDKLMRKYPDEPVAHYHLGMAWYQKGERARAKLELSRALQLNPPKEIETGAHDLLNRVN